MAIEHNRIRERAYKLWEEADRTGVPENHWLRAERELKEGSRNAAPIAGAEGDLPGSPSSEGEEGSTPDGLSSEAPN
jgi:hypothetical protein